MFSISRLKGVEKRIEMALKLLLEPGPGKSRW
jgi:hypothetical protein